MKVVVLLLGMTIWAATLQAGLNCPDGKAAVSITTSSSPTVNAAWDGSQWNFTASGSVSVSINCDITPCVTQGSMGIEVYSSGASVASGSAIFNHAPLCEDGDSVDVIATLSGSSPLGHEPDSAAFQ